MAYGFKRKDCYCGLNLVGQQVEVFGLYRDTMPVGKCPECGLKLLLDAEPVSLVVEEEVPEEVPVVEETPIVEKETLKRSHHKKVG